MNDADKRRELQLVLLREGFSQDYARKAAEDWVITPDTIATLEKMREDAKRFPERQIVPPGAVDLADVKSQREEALADVEEAQYFENQVRLAEFMKQLFSLPEMPLAVIQTLLDVMQEGGTDRLAAMADIIKLVEGLRIIQSGRAS